MGMNTLGYTPGVLRKEAEAIENKGDEVFSLAKERARETKECISRQGRRGWAVKVTTKVMIYGA
jgi:hypothetical protein